MEEGREFARENTALSFVRSGCSPAEPACRAAIADSMPG